MNDFITTDINKMREYIAAGRDKTSRAIANNTRATIDGNNINIRLHSTDVVIMTDNCKESGYIIDSGGWRSVTTKERINRYIPNHVYQNKGVWYIDGRDGEQTLFYDGMQLDADGYPTEPRPTGKYEKALAGIKKQAKQYARDYVEAIKAGALDMPGAGDCLYCQFGQQAENMPGEHIALHIKESYYVPSLLVNAARAAGYRDFQIGLMGIGGQTMIINPERIIYRYVVKQLQRGL